MSACRRQYPGRTDGIVRSYAPIAPPGEGETVLTNAHGYIYALGPQLDGFLPQSAWVGASR
jgi:hypothetical protein